MLAVFVFCSLYLGGSVDFASMSLGHWPWSMCAASSHDLHSTSKQNPENFDLLASCRAAFVSIGVCLFYAPVDMMIFSVGFAAQSNGKPCCLHRHLGNGSNLQWHF